MRRKQLFIEKLIGEFKQVVALIERFSANDQFKPKEFKINRIAQFASLKSIVIDSVLNFKSDAQTFQEILAKLGEIHKQCPIAETLLGI